MNLLIDYTMLSSEVKDDPDLVRWVLRKPCNAFHHVPEKFQEDREILVSVMKECGWYLDYVTEELKNDNYLVILAIQSIGSIAYKFASPER